MQDLTKIATCCYCGTRAVLQLRGRERHELSCSSCGAALHNMKPLKSQAHNPRPKTEKASRTSPYLSEKSRKPKHRKQKKRKGWGYMLGELFDEIEDIFD